MGYIQTALDDFLPQTQGGFAWIEPYEPLNSIIRKTMENNPKVIRNVMPDNAIYRRLHRKSIRNSIRDTIKELS